MSGNKFIWLLESSRSGYAMAAFETEELALEALKVTRDRLVERWKDLGSEAWLLEHKPTEIDNGAFSVMDDLTYTIHELEVEVNDDQ